MEKIMECKFCNIFKNDVLHKKELFLNKTPIYNTILCETPSFFVIPDLGSIIEGYLLIITKEHFYSMAELKQEQLHELHILINLLSEMAIEIYGIMPIIFEHGSPPFGMNVVSQSSICHAHMHLVPFELNNSCRIIKEADMYLFNGIEFLNKYKKMSYIYYKTSKKENYITTNQNLPRQYMRRKVAIEVNKNDEWDWREYPFIDNVQKTIMSYQKILKTNLFNHSLLVNGVERGEHI